jgi:hypothetical protein
LGVWQAFSPGHGREDDETAGEREPLLAKTKTQTQTQTRESRARRKVVFDVDDTTSEDVTQGSTVLAPVDSEKEAESRLVAAAERTAKAARAARLERAKAAREDAERRAKRARAKTVENKPVGDLTREELLERARGELPKRANASCDTGIPGSR